MLSMKLFNYGLRDDYGKDYYFTFLKGKKYSLLQVSFDIGEYSKWTELPYFQFSSGNGRLISILFTISKFGISFDIFGRNWRDELFYTQPKEMKND